MPSLELLKELVIDRQNSTPIHIQVHQSLRQIIARDFADGDAFFTEAQLVERFGVSRPTVRQALAELTREGVLLRRPSIGTVVVRAKMKPSRVRTQHVGVFLTDFDSEYTAMLLQQIILECRRRRFEMHTYYIHQGESAEMAAQQILHSPDEEGLIVLGSGVVLQWLKEKNYRVVSIETLTTDEDDPVVETDARMAVQMGVDYLRTLGHRQITLLVNEPAAVISVQEKIEQFRQSLPQGRVVICGTQVWDNSYQAAYAHMGEVWNLAPADRPTAIITTSDPGAWAALRWFSEKQVSVPEQVSVLGFEDARSSRFMHPSLSTIAHPIEAIARTAVTVLWDKDDGPRHRLLTPSLIIRESTGPAPA